MARGERERDGQYKEGIDISPQKIEQENQQTCSTSGDGIASSCWADRLFLMVSTN